MGGAVGRRKKTRVSEYELDDAPGMVKVEAMEARRFKKGVDGIVDAQANSMLHVYTKGNELQHAEQLLKVRATVDHRNDDERTPLHFAALYGIAPAVPFLVSYGADLRARDVDGRTPLHLAAMHGFQDTCKALLRGAVREAGQAGLDENMQVERVAAYIDLQDSIGRSSLGWAIYSGGMKEKQLAQVQKRIQNEAEHVKSRKVFYNFCMMATGNQLAPCWGAWQEYRVIVRNEKAVAETSAELDRLFTCCEMFVKYNCALELKDLWGGTTLHYSLDRRPADRAKLWEMLLKDKVAWASPSQWAKEGPRGPLLHHCCEVGDEELLAFLARKMGKYSEYLDIQDAQKNTPLHVAAATGSRAVIQVLLDLGANTDALNALNQTAAEVAMTKSPGVIDLLKYSPPIGSLAGAGDIGKVRDILKAKGAVDRVDADQRTPLMAACLTKQVEVVQVLLNYKADANRRDVKGTTSFQWLLDPTDGDSPASVDIARMLVKSGLDLASRTPKEGACGFSTPLLLCCRAGFLRVTEQLLAGRADVNAQDVVGTTPLMHAVSNEKVELIKMLLGAKGDPMVQDSRGFTAVDKALASKNLKIRNSLTTKKGKAAT